MHYYLDFQGYRLSLVGSVITIFDSSGRKVRQYFYSNHKAAKSVFMSLVQGLLVSGKPFLLWGRRERQGVLYATGKSK